MRQSTFLPGPVALNIALISGSLLSYPWKPMSVVPDGMTCNKKKVCYFVLNLNIDILLHVSKLTAS